MPTRHNLLLEFDLISKESYDALESTTKYFLKASEETVVYLGFAYGAICCLRKGLVELLL